MAELTQFGGDPAREGTLDAAVARHLDDNIVGRGAGVIGEAREALQARRA